MKVMHIESGRHLYGGARQVLYLVEGLAKRGVDNLVVCPSGSEIAIRVKHAKIPVHPTQMSGDLDFGLIRRLAAIIEDNQPDLIHLHSRRGADWLGGMAARKFPSIPVVLSRRVDNTESKLVAKYKYRLFDRVVVISKAISEVLINVGVPSDKLEIVHSAVDPDTWKNRWDRLAFLKTFFPDQEALHKNDYSGPVIGMVAQLIDRKGHRFVVEALPAIQEVFPQAKVIFFGRGREGQNLERLVASLKLEDSVQFAGFRKDINHWLGCLDVFVHPPLAEGLGVAVLQAAAASLPIVASNVGGVPEIIEDCVNGYLVEPGNVEQISQRVIDLLSDREAAAAFGKAAHDKVAQHFSVDAMVEGNLAVYKKLLAGR